MTDNIYNYFDDIVCINLDISVDRRKHAEHYFHKLNIPARFYTATKHPNGGIYGCFHSHIQILKDAYDRGLNNVLVFEDDVLPSDTYSEEKMGEALNFMKSNEDWDIMYLGYSILRDDIHNGLSTIMDGKHVSKNVIQFNPFCTFALCYSKRAIKQIVETYESYIGIVHYDMYLSIYAGLTNYCFVPMIFDQNFYFEYNVQPTDGLEHFLRLMYPLWGFTKINYRITVLKYLFNKYRNLMHYLHLFIFSLVLYKIKKSLLFSFQKKYVAT